jgi:hypothetical protein
MGVWNDYEGASVFGTYVTAIKSVRKRIAWWRDSMK